MSDLIAVTGATGGLGTLVIDRLLRRNTPDRIVALARDAGKAAALPQSVQVRIADHDDRAAVDAAMAGIDVLLLISGNEFGRRMTQTPERDRGRRSKPASPGSSTPAPRTPAPARRRSLLSTRPPKQLIGDSGLTYTMLRINYLARELPAAPDHGAADRLDRRQRARRSGSGGASAAKADYADAVAVVLTTTGHDNAVYELTGDTAWDYHQLAVAVSEVTGAD